jgi:hypothetical protein
MKPTLIDIENILAGYDECGITQEEREAGITVEMLIK